MHKTTISSKTLLSREVKPVSRATEGRERVQFPGLQIGIKKYVLAISKRQSLHCARILTSFS